MRKSEKNLIIMSVALVLCIACYFGITAFNSAKSKAEEEAEEASTIYLGSIDSPSNIALTISGECYSYSKIDDEWVWDENPDFPLSSTSLDDLSDLVTGLTAARSFEAEENLTDYGFDGTYEVTVTDSDGDTLTLSIGSKASDSTCYVMEDGDPLIYTVDSSVRTKSIKTPYDMITLDTVPAIDRDYLSSIEIISGDDTIEIIYDSSGNVTVSVNGEMLRTMTDAESAIYSTFESNIATGINFISCYGYDVSEEELESCGLSPAEIEMIVRYIDEDTGELTSYDILYGSTAADNQYKYYAKLSDSLELNSVYSGGRSYVVNLIDVFINV